MRRNLLKEETEVPLRFTAPQPSQEPLKAEPAQALAVPGMGTVARPESSRKARLGGGRALRVGILLFSSVGLFTLIVPSVTGIPLGEWLQGANFKAAYSGANLNYMRGATALKLGNLAATTDALLALPAQSTEAQELAVVLFPKLVTAGDYARAVQVCKHVIPPAALEAGARTKYINTGQSAAEMQAQISSTVNLKAVGKSMATTLGPEKALALIAATPELNATRDLLIPSLFTAIGAQVVTVKDSNGLSQSLPVRENIDLLEKLIPTLSGLSQQEAINALIAMYIRAKELGPAWEWSAKLPDQQRIAQRESIMVQTAGYHPELALRLLNTLPAGKEADALCAYAMSSIAYALPAEAPRLLARISTDSSTQRNIALKYMLQSSKITAKIPLLEQITDPAIKVESLTYAMNYTNKPEELERIVTYFTEFARKNPQFTAQHDHALQNLAVASKVFAQQEGYINRMLDPVTKVAALKKWQEGKLNSGGPSEAGEARS